MSFEKDMDVSGGQAGVPKYQPPTGYSDSYWPNTLPDLESTRTNPAEQELLYRKAAARVKAKIRLYRHFFIYLVISTAAWIFNIAANTSNRFGFRENGTWLIPIFIVAVGGLVIGWEFFKVFILNNKDYQEMLEEEVRKMRRF
jgi:hypothetical protein